MKAEQISFNNVTSEYNGTVILRNISFSIFEDEAVCLFTPDTLVYDELFLLLAGEREPIEGTISFEERESGLSEKSISIRRSPMLADHLNIAENLFLTNDDAYHMGLLNKKLIYNLADDVIRAAGFTDVNPKAKLGSLSTVEKHYIEILRTLTSHKNVLIIGEITNDFNQAELARLKELLLYIRSKGITVVYITDKINDSINIAQRLIAISSDRSVENFLPIAEQEFIDSVFNKKDRRIEPQLPMKDTVMRITFLNEIRNHAPICIHSNEVVGIYDDTDTLNSRIFQTISGMDPDSDISLSLRGNQIKLLDRSDSIDKGIFSITEKDTLYFSNISLVDNIVITAKKEVVRFNGNASEKQIAAELALEMIGQTKLLSLYGAYRRMPPVGKDVQIAIAIARSLCSCVSIVAIFNPYITTGEYVLAPLDDILANLKKHGVSCIIFSKQERLLQDLCDSVYNLSSK